MLGLCNSHCKQRKDHNTIEPGSQRHTAEEDAKLLAGCAWHVMAE
jgi:hypothetical protein